MTAAVTFSAESDIIIRQCVISAVADLSASDENFCKSSKKTISAGDKPELSHL